MPDIQTEMQKILQAWDSQETTETTQPTEQPKETTVFTPTTNTSRETFNMVRNHHGSPKKEIIRLLSNAGFKPSSTSSLLSQMMRQGLVWVDSSGGLHPNQQEYTPLKPAKLFSAKTKTSKVITSKPQRRPKVAAVQLPDEGITALIERREMRSKVEVILDDISLSDAHELYRRLHQYFGGLPK